jgi:hypothetical protein
MHEVGREKSKHHHGPDKNHWLDHSPFVVKNARSSLSCAICLLYVTMHACTQYQVRICIAVMREVCVSDEKAESSTPHPLCYVARKIRVLPR